MGPHAVGVQPDPQGGAAVGEVPEDIHALDAPGEVPGDIHALDAPEAGHDDDVREVDEVLLVGVGGGRVDVHIHQLAVRREDAALAPDAAVTPGLRWLLCLCRGVRPVGQGDVDDEIRQRLEDLRLARSGDLGMVGRQDLEPRESLEVPQAGIADCGTVDPQVFQAGQTRQVGQARVGDPGFARDADSLSPCKRARCASPSSVTGVRVRYRSVSPTRGRRWASPGPETWVPERFSTFRLVIPPR